MWCSRIYHNLKKLNKIRYNYVLYFLSYYFSKGFFGLAEEEWLGVMKEFDPKIIGYEDFC